MLCCCSNDGNRILDSSRNPLFRKTKTPDFFEVNIRTFDAKHPYFCLEKSDVLHLPETGTCYWCWICRGGLMAARPTWRRYGASGGFTSDVALCKSISQWYLAKILAQRTTTTQKKGVETSAVRSFSPRLFLCAILLNIERSKHEFQFWTRKISESLKHSVK